MWGDVGRGQKLTGQQSCCDMGDGWFCDILGWVDGLGWCELWCDGWIVWCGDMDCLAWFNF